MRLRRWAFRGGIAMIAYDLAGHACALLAHLTGPYGAYLWNTYAGFVWPSLEAGLVYQAYWTLFFTLALTGILWGRSCSSRETP